MITNIKHIQKDKTYVVKWAGFEEVLTFRCYDRDNENYLFVYEDGSFCVIDEYDFESAKEL